jgi:hypothetical protein
MNPVLRDFRYAIRTLGKSPGFAAVAVLTLALGIAVNTAIFSVINGLLLHPAGIANADRLAAIRVKYDKLNLPNIGSSAAYGHSIGSGNRTFRKS